jgi:hypothetical protein
MFLASGIATCVLHYVLVQGIIDEVNLPLGNCDTSIYEETMNETERS